MTVATTALQVMSFVGMLIIAGICATVWRRWPEFWYMAVAPGVWATFGIVFYVLLFAGYLSPQAVLLWGAAHRLMAVILLLSIVVLLWAVLREGPEPPPQPDEWGDDDE